MLVVDKLLEKYYDVHGVDPYFPDADYEYEHYEDWNNYYNEI